MSPILRLTRRLAVAALAIAGLVTLTSAQAQPGGRVEYPIRGPGGAAVMNHTLSPAQAARVAGLNAVAMAGNPHGDVTLYKLYDLNCPYCRRASQDVAAIIKADPKLRVIFIPYAVLSVASIQAAMVELQVMDIAPGRIMEFHRRVYAQRGTIDGQRALAAAKDMGLDPKTIVARANTGGATDTLKAHALLGGELGLQATPAYVVSGIAITGHPGRDGLERVIAAIRKCGKPVC